MTALRAWKYMRTSTEDQGFSFETQGQKIKEFITLREWNLVGESQDEHTGRNTMRKGYQEAMDRIDEWDVFIVYKMDRAHRNVRNLWEMLNRFDEKGKVFASAHELIDTSTANGKFFITIIGGVAQWESDVIGERVKAGVGTYKGRGYNWGPVPRWFDIQTINGIRQALPTDEALGIEIFVKAHSRQAAAREYGCSRRAIQRLLANLGRWRSTCPWIRPEPD